MYGHPSMRLSEPNTRTATKATIRRASSAARTKMRALDRELEQQLEGVYARAVDDLRGYLQSRAGADNTLRIEVMRDLLDQAQARLNNMAAERNGLMNTGLFDAADLGAQPFVDAGMSLTNIPDEAVRFVTSFVAEDGLQLSDRIWRLDNHARQVLSDEIQRAVIQGHSASQAVQDLLARGMDVPADLARKMNAAQWDRIYRGIKNGIFTGEGSVYSDAMRVMRTEINRAHGEAYMAAAFDHPDVIGTRFLLSPAHPRTDICDMHASVNLYGLGAGVYPKGKNPWPAHPNTLSFVEVVFIDEVTEEDRQGKEDPIDWLNRQPAGVQEGVLGSRRKRAALARGWLKKNHIATPWNRLEAIYRKKGYDVDGLRPDPIVAPIVPGTKMNLTEAVNYCVTQGHNTGWEYACILDADTGEALLRKTSKYNDKVLFTTAEMSVMTNPANNVRLVHNHPRSSSLSFPDLHMAGHDGVHSIVAAGHDGSTYLAQVLVSQEQLRDLGLQVVYAVERKLRPLVNAGEVAPDVAGLVDPHLRNLALHDLGYIQYRPEPGPVTQNAVKTMGTRKFNKLRREVVKEMEVRK